MYCEGFKKKGFGKILFARSLLGSSYVFSYYTSLLEKDGSPIDIQQIHSTDGGCLRGPWAGHQRQQQELVERMELHQNHAV